MLSPETLESYRRMKPGERLRLTLDLCDSAWPAMLQGKTDIIERRFQRLREENESRNQAICKALYSTASSHQPTKRVD
ncbi:hypothetical protein SH449x_000247 [Pirellulaceae bacterium SH449]